jgi:hypothetical protein
LAIRVGEGGRAAAAASGFDLVEQRVPLFDARLGLREERPVRLARQQRQERQRRLDVSHEADLDGETEAEPVVDA